MARLLEEIDRDIWKLNEGIQGTQERIAAAGPDEREWVQLLVEQQREMAALREERNMQQGDFVQAIVRETLAQHQAQLAKPKPSSSVGSTEADGILAALGLVEIRGNALQPFEVPAGTPTCSSFDYSRYANEDQGTAQLLKHHQQQLAGLGIKFGEVGGFEMHDSHESGQLYRICAPNDQEYVGNVDGFVAPFGFATTASASREARIIYVHKQSSKQQGSETAAVAYTGGTKGQVVVAMLAAYAYNSYPLMFDLTDGEVHHLVQIQGANVYLWDNLTPTQAYYKQALELRSKPLHELNLPSIPELKEVLEGAPNKRLRTALRGNVGTLKDLRPP